MKPNEEQVLNEALKGNVPAVRFCQMVFQISQVLDDLIDKDKPVTEYTVMRVFHMALFDLPKNPFYQQHHGTLMPVMERAMVAWWDSTVMERTGEAHDRHLAFVLRDQLTDVVIEATRLVGGFNWQMQISTQLRRFFMDESFADYAQQLEPPEKAQEPQEEG